MNIIKYIKNPIGILQRTILETMLKFIIYLHSDNSLVIAKFFNLIFLYLLFGYRFPQDTESIVFEMCCQF